jgi:hypothetical protein
MPNDAAHHQDGHPFCAVGLLIMHAFWRTDPHELHSLLPPHTPADVIAADTIKNKGLFWELNPGPLAPEARIMPLDQTANIGTEKHGNNQLRRVRKHHKPFIPLNLTLRLALCCTATHANTLTTPLPQNHGWAGLVSAIAKNNM